MKCRVSVGWVCRFHWFRPAPCISLLIDLYKSVNGSCNVGVGLGHSMKFGQNRQKRRFGVGFGQIPRLSGKVRKGLFLGKVPLAFHRTFWALFREVAILASFGGKRGFLTREWEKRGFWVRVGRFWAKRAKSGVFVDLERFI